MVGIVVVYEHAGAEYNEDWHTVLEAKSESILDIAKAIKEYGILDWALERGAIYIIKESVNPSLIIQILKTLSPP